MDYLSTLGKILALGLLTATIVYAWKRNIPRTLICGLSCIATFVLEI